MINQDLCEILECSDCRGELSFINDDFSLRCLKCNRRFKFNGSFFDFTPSNAYEHPLQKDEEFQRWLNYEGKDVVKQWVYESPSILSTIQKSSHKIAERISKIEGDTLLDIGAGYGQYFDCIKHSISKYRYIFVLDLNERALRYNAENYKFVIPIKGSAYRLPFKKGTINKVVTMYLWEHLYFLEEHFESLNYISHPEGEILAGIPTEGGFLWNFGRRLTTARYYKKRGFDYEKIIKISHCNSAKKIIQKARNYFDVKEIYFWPFNWQIYAINLTVTLRLQKKRLQEKRY